MTETTTHLRGGTVRRDAIGRITDVQVHVCGTCRNWARDCTRATEEAAR